MASTSHVANFGARFCNELNTNKNCICSPLSAETVLALVALGSSNQARAEIFKALDIPDEANLRSTFMSLTETFESKKPFIEIVTSIFNKQTKQNEQTNNITLKIANKIYVKQGEALNEGLKKDAKKVFKSSLEQIDFSKSNDAANSINNWVSNQTNDIIKELVSADMLNEETALVLVNAIYFQGFWEIKFKANDTYPREFHVNNTKKVKIENMSKEGVGFNYKHSPELDAKILQMFYEGGEASMVIVLPDEIEGINDVMKKLSDGYDLMTDVKSLERTRLKVVIPKFTIETEINLKELLPKMGIKTIFDPNNRDINMLSSGDRLYVSEAIQKAFIAVHEKGTEAAAATGFSIQLCCATFWDSEFIADRPFLYILMAHKIPIFYGIFHGN